MDQVAALDNLDELTDEQMDVLERQIAGKYMNIIPWGTVVWGISNCLVFISLFPLVLTDIPATLAGLPSCNIECTAKLSTVP